MAAMTSRKASTSTTVKAARVTAAQRTAWHEAGHTVISSAINDMPDLVSIRTEGVSFGRNSMKMFARPSSLTQVYLAGFAAEHILTGRRSRHLGEEVAFAILAESNPAFREAFMEDGRRDGHGAVQQLLRMGVPADDEEIKREVERFYDITRESLTVVWPAVEAVAHALLKQKELSRGDLEEILGPFGIYVPVVLVQRAHGMLLPKAKG